MHKVGLPPSAIIGQPRRKRSRNMPSSKTDPPFAATYLLVLSLQLLVWLGRGLLWGMFMVVLVGWHPMAAPVGGLWWGLLDVGSRRQSYRRRYCMAPIC